MEKTERYNYVFDQYDGDSFIYDLKEDKRIEDLSECANILNKKEKEIERWVYHKKVDAQINRELIDEIEELESRLSNCIEPKFKIGQEVWFVNKRNGYDAKVECAKIENLRIFALKSKIQINYRISDSCCSIYDRHSYKQKELFTTEEEAKAKLEELKDENKETC